MLQAKGSNGPLPPGVTPPVIELRDVRVAFAGKGAILRGVNLTVEPARIVLVAGQAESGKTTLLEVAAGIRAPDSGEVFVTGKPFWLAPGFEDRPLRIRTGMVFQTATLLSNLNLYGNIALPLRYHFAPPEREVEVMVLRLAAMLDLTPHLDLMPAQASLVVKKRANIAMVLALQPAGVIIDEPFAGVDPLQYDGFAAMLRRLRDELGVALLMAANGDQRHSQVPDRVLTLANGVIEGARLGLEA